MLDVLRLLDRADDFAGPDGLALRCLRDERPRLLARKAWEFQTAEDEVSRPLLEARQGPLHAIVDAPEESRA